MKRQNLELIIIGILALIFLVVLSGVLKKASKKEALPQEAVTETIGKTKQVSEKSSQATAQKVSAPPISWGRDPFLLTESDAFGRGTSISLGGIIWSKTKPKALINNELYGIGDKIGDTEIVDIEKNNITVKERNEIRKITLD